MDKIELKYKSVSDIPLKWYGRIKEIMSDDMLSDAERDIAFLSVLCDVDEKEIWNMELQDVQSLRFEAMRQKSIPKGIVPNSIKIGELELDVVKDIANIKYNQYVDFQTYFKDLDNNRAEILSVILVPKGHKYNDGYNMQELIEAINDNITIHQFNVILNFFLEGLERLTKVSLRSLALWMRMKSWMTRNKRERELYKDMEKEVKHLQSLVG